MTLFQDKVALVTGASRGIGREIARTLADGGATTLLNARREESLAEPVAEMRAAGLHAEPLAFDVSDGEAVARAFERLAKRHGRLDILVNNAGIVSVRDVFDTTLEDWQRELGTNLTGPFLCSKAALAMMRSQRAGRIIMISSTAGQRGSPLGAVAYSAAKAGLLGLTKTLAHTAAPYGVTVNAVAPGMTETDMLRESFGDRLAEAASAVPLGMGHTRDIAQAVAYLASDAARYVTGTTLDVNGGIYMR